MRFACVALVIGMSVTSVRADYLVDPSFEAGTGTTPSGLPHSYGIWQYDWAEYIGADQGIVPFDGTKMLKFNGALAANRTNPSNFEGSETIQLFDLTSIAGYNPFINYRVTATAYFNRIVGDAETDSEFELTVGGWSGDPSSFSNLYNNPSRVFDLERLVTDADPSTWEAITVSIDTLPGTTYLSLRLAALENIFNDLSGSVGPEFDGHYADKVSMTITAIPEASSVAMLSTLAIASLGFSIRRRR